MVNSGQNQNDISSLKEMGFEESLIKEALKACDNNRERATEWILQKMSEPPAAIAYGPHLPGMAPNKNEDEELSKAVELSLMCNNQNQNIVEVRDPSLPLGLRNNGNIPYFTILIQLLHSVPRFKKIIFDQPISGNFQDPHKKKLLKMLNELKNIFNLMDESKKKFEDSNQIFLAYSDIDGPYQIDNNKNDVADYLLKIVSRVEEGLKCLVQDNESSGLRKDSMNFLLENPIISDLFYGKTVSLTHYKENGARREKKLGPEMPFGKFEIEAENKELYEAWEKAMVKKIDNLQAGESTVDAKLNYWIQSLPKILIFDIKRQQFDAQGNPIKSKKAFGFPEKLHPGRFLFENSSKSSKLQKSMRANKRKVKNLEKSIEKFENFNGTELNISKMLGFCSEFLRGQESGLDVLDGNDFEIINLEGKSKQDISTTYGVVKSYSDKVQDVLASMKQDLETLTNEIESAFNNEKFNKTEYELTTVVVHDGDVGSGQFYSYMQSGGRWRKYNDINVTEVNFKEVLYHSLGEYGISAACCLVYSLKED